MGTAATPAPVAFGVVTGRQVHDILSAQMADIVDLVGDTYRAHARSLASNPPSHFLRFDDRPRDRIIALMADLRDETPVAGLKWIASWPENVRQGIPRASAVIVLNRRDTGYPYAILEGSIISAVRTAASAVLAAEHLRSHRATAGGKHARIGFVGCGLIARHVVDMFQARGWQFDRVMAFDVTAESAAQMLRHVAARTEAETVATCSCTDLIAASDIVVFATTATTPHVVDTRCFDHGPLVLHVSLRDLSPAIILAANNVVDDVDHCLQAQTSAHLAEQQVGHRDFVSGTIVDALAGRLDLDPRRATIFSPFGMGILDIALARRVYQEAQRRNAVHDIPHFFHDVTRWVDD